MRRLQHRLVPSRARGPAGRPTCTRGARWGLALETRRVHDAGPGRASGRARPRVHGVGVLLLARDYGHVASWRMSAREAAWPVVWWGEEDEGLVKVEGI